MKKKIGALIVDDVELERRRLRRLLGSDPEIEILGECGSGSEAVAAIQEHSPDLVFLDVQMPPGIDGFEVLEAVNKEKMPLVVFVTGFHEYALPAHRAHPIDYLLKPYDDDRFREALAEAKQLLRTKQHAAMWESMLEELKSSSQPAEGAYKEYLKVVKDERAQLIEVKSINWVEAKDKEVILYLTEGAPLLHREFISDLAKRLDPKIFLRIHRSYIVNYKYIKNMSRVSRRKWLVTLRDGTNVWMSDSRYKRLFEDR